MSDPVYTYPRRTPPLYRLARALRVLSILVLVVLILFTLSVVYSTAQLAQSPPKVGSFSAGFGSNGTMILAGSLTINNPGFYPIQGLALDARVANDSGLYLGSFGFGPATLSGQATDEFPVQVYLPLTATGPGASLLIHSQIIRIALWGNATFGYVFPAGLSLEQNRSWGAPFNDLAVSVGNVSANGTASVTVSFQNQASLAEAGSLDASVVAASGITCGTATWVLNVAAEQSFAQTQPITLSPGCSPEGGNLEVVFSTPGYSVPLPPEPIP